MRRRPVVRILSAPVLAVLAACASTPLPPEAVQVAVYQAPLGAAPAASRMPVGCREVLRTPPEHRSELDIAGSKDPYRAQRVATAGAGGNVLLVLDHQITSRSDFDCPAASPITDCPPSMGAWFDVVFVSYACSAQSLGELPRERRP
jgi:hypothetical protein